MQGEGSWVRYRVLLDGRWTEPRCARWMGDERRTTLLIRHVDRVIQSGADVTDIEMEPCGVPSTDDLIAYMCAVQARIESLASLVTDILRDLPAVPAEAA
jgi:hypothetical protein